MKNITDFFLTENFQFLEVKLSTHLNRCVFVMDAKFLHVENGDSDQTARMNQKIYVLTLRLYLIVRYNQLLLEVHVSGST